MKVNKPPVPPLFRHKHKSRGRAFTSGSPQSHFAHRISSAVTDSAPFQGPVARQSYGSVSAEWSDPQDDTRQSAGPVGIMITVTMPPRDRLFQSLACASLQKKEQIRLEKRITSQQYSTMCPPIPAQPPSAPRPPPARPSLMRSRVVRRVRSQAKPPWQSRRCTTMSWAPEPGTGRTPRPGTRAGRWRRAG